MVAIPVYSRVSKKKVKCSICGRKMICRKCLDWYIKRYENNPNITEKDWVCIVCESDYIISDYAEEVVEW